MENRHQLALETGSKINQEIAAADDIEAGEGRILDQILTREHAHVPDRLANQITALNRLKIASHPFRTDSAHIARTEHPGPRPRDRRLTDVSPEDLDRNDPA